MVYKVIQFIDNIDKVRDLCYVFYFFNLMQMKKKNKKIN